MPRHIVTTCRQPLQELLKTDTYLARILNQLEQRYRDIIRANPRDTKRQLDLYHQHVRTQLYVHTHFV